MIYIDQIIHSSIRYTKLKANSNLFSFFLYTLYSSFAHDVILSHWAPSWLILQITLAVNSEIVVSIWYFIVSLSVL